jgi:hypothetical protein
VPFFYGFFLFIFLFFLSDVPLVIFLFSPLDPVYFSFAFSLDSVSLFPFLFFPSTSAATPLTSAPLSPSNQYRANVSYFLHRHPVRIASVGLVFALLVCIGLMAAAGVQWESGPGSSGSLAQIAFILVFLVSTRSGIVNYVIGVPFERALNVRGREKYLKDRRPFLQGKRGRKR